MRFPPALSFSDNIELKELFEVATGSGSFRREGLVVFTGAGVSLDAGLPNWDRLVEGLLSEVDPDFADWAGRDLMSLSRKVSVIEPLLPPHRTFVEVVRTSLYRSFSAGRGSDGAKIHVNPGLLALSIARFVAARSDKRLTRTVVGTLNFDDLLEIALTKLTSPKWSPISPDDWDETSTPNAVIHFHGALPSTGGGTIDPIILSEANLVSSGSAVQSKMVEIMSTRNVIFVGLSLADPNLVASLLSLHRSENEFRRFVVVSPE